MGWGSRLKGRSDLCIVNNDYTLVGSRGKHAGSFWPLWARPAFGNKTTVPEHEADEADEAVETPHGFHSGSRAKPRSSSRFKHKARDSERSPPQKTEDQRTISDILPQHDRAPHDCPACGVRLTLRVRGTLWGRAWLISSTRQISILHRLDRVFWAFSRIRTQRITRHRQMEVSD